TGYYAIDSASRSRAAYRDILRRATRRRDASRAHPDSTKRSASVWAIALVAVFGRQPRSRRHARARWRERREPQHHRARLGRHAERIRDSEHARRLRDRACAHRAGDRGPDQHHSHLDAVHGVCWRLRRARRSLGLRLMGDPVFVQFPFVGGLDEKTAATYLDPDQNQASILNGSFRYVGRVDKRFGIKYDKELGACAVLNPSGVADPYVAPSFYATALGGLGVQILQGPWAWVEQAGTVAYAGKRPNFAAVRRPLPARSIAVPLICDGVVSLQGTVRAAAWIGEPQEPAGASNFQIESSLLDSATSQQVLKFPTLAVTGQNITLINLVWLPNNGTLALFLVLETTGSASRELRAYTVTPGSADNHWTLQAGATTQLWNSDTTCLDVQPMSGDPNDGWIALYLPSTTQTQLTWRYFQNFASVATGTLANTGFPGKSAMQIVADWGVDVALVWNDNPNLPGHDNLHIDYLSADGLFTTLASYSADPSVTAALGDFGYTLWEIGGACRVADKTNATLNSEIFVSFWAQDGTLFSSGGPNMPITMGGIVARSGGNVITPMGFAYYPFGLRPLVRPGQVLDGQIVGEYIHISHACAQDYQIGAGTNPTAATLVSEQCTEYLVDFRVRAEAGVPLALASSQATIVATVAPRQLDP